MSLLEETPRGFLEPVKCRKNRCTTLIARITNGKIKCKAKNRVKAELPTANPPHSHKTISSPTYGIALKRFVITVAPQNLICPQGSTYPKKAVAIVSSKMVHPIIHT